MTGRYERADDEWGYAQAEEGWQLPAKAAWPWRLWGIRHARALWHGYRADKLASEMGKAGLGDGYMPPYDEWRLYAIWRGWA